MKAPPPGRKTQTPTPHNAESSKSSHPVGVTTYSWGQLEFSLPWKTKYYMKGRSIDAFVESRDSLYVRNEDSEVNVTF